MNIRRVASGPGTHVPCGRVLWRRRAIHGSTVVAVCCFGVDIGVESRDGSSPACIPATLLAVPASDGVGWVEAPVVATATAGVLAGVDDSWLTTPGSGVTGIAGLAATQGCQVRRLAHASLSLVYTTPPRQPMRRGAINACVNGSWPCGRHAHAIYPRGSARTSISHGIGEHSRQTRRHQEERDNAATA